MELLIFYVYLWLRENGTPYYVGKGTGDRAYIDHYLRGGRIRRVPPMDRIVFYVAKDEADALEIERDLIWYYGRKDLGTGCLINLTDGGENPPNWKGKKRSDHHRKAMIVVALSRSPVTEETRKRMSVLRTGTVGYWRGKKRIFSEEHRRKLSEAGKGKVGPHKGEPWSEARRTAQNRKTNERSQ